MVIIDCGHGGDDPGKVTATISEKEFTLKVGKQLAERLKDKGYQVCMTRDCDKTVSLDERTGIANAHADNAVLLSLHGNASTNPEAKGIETYFMAPDLFFTELSCMDHLELETINNHVKNRGEYSKNLASFIHKNLLKAASGFQNVRDRKVKKQAGQVLFGQMPSILIEFGFLSNSEECALLKDETYQEALIGAVSAGLNEFFETSFA